MTVNSTLGRQQYTGTGATRGPYTFAAPVQLDSDLLVQVGTTTPTTLVLGTDYTVTGSGQTSTGVDINLSVAYGNLPLGATITISRDIPLTQENAYVPNDPFPAKTHEGALDKLTLIEQQQNDSIGRAFRLASTTSVSLVPEYNDTPTDGTTLVFTGTGGNLKNGPSVGDIADAAGNATIATNAAIDAQTSKNTAQAAANTAVAVAASLSRDVVILVGPVTHTVIQADNGKQFACNTAAGQVNLNLPAISTLSFPFTVGMEKTTTDVNSVLITSNGTDVIGDAGATTKSLLQQGQSCDLIPDTDPSPDEWFVHDYGQVFTAPVNINLVVGTDVAVGATSFTLPTVLPSSAGLIFSIDGTVQHPKIQGTIDWTYNPANGLMTLASPILPTMKDIFIYGFAATTIITPAAGTVSFTSLASALIASAAEIIAGTANKIVSAANLITAFPSILWPLKVGTKVGKSTTQTLSTGTNTISFDAEEYDDANWHNPVTNNSRITVDYIGRVSLSVNLFMIYTGSGQGVLNIYKNGSLFQVGPLMVVSSSASIGGSMTLETICAANDFFEVIMTGVVAATSAILQVGSTFSGRKIK